jgi:peptidoglycan/xylan/chitin deacetylase (PgdA/CDA1 family)
MTNNLVITTSWDDGHPLDFRIAEMLTRHGLTGTFYIPREIETEAMSEAQVRELSSSFEIGAHTLNHVFLTDVPNTVARAEIVGSRRWVQEVTGKTCAMFCPPAGRFNSHHVTMFRDAGYAGIRTVEFMSLDRPRPRNGLLEMPTSLQAHPQPTWNYMKNLSKRLAITGIWRYLRIAKSREWVNLAQRLLDLAQQTGGVFHLWGHSWEIEAHQQWNQLDQVLAMLGQAVRNNVPCWTNGQLCEGLQPAGPAAEPT